VTHARRLRKTDGLVVWSRPAARIRNYVRGLQPWPGAYTHYLPPQHAPIRLIVDQVSVVDPELAQHTLAGQAEPLVPGQVAFVDARQLWIQTGEGLLALNRVQPAGKRAMPVSDFLHGHQLARGDRFGDLPETPAA
jgi:methionyl-tRNA formyltransferase